MILTETLTAAHMDQIFYGITVIIVGIFGYLLKDFHKLIKNLHETVQELNTTTQLIRNTSEKEMKMMHNIINDRTRRLAKIEEKLNKYDSDITEFYKSFHDTVRTIVKQEMNHKND